MNELQLGLLKKIKMWTLVVAILSIIMGLMYTLAVIGFLSMQTLVENGNTSGLSEKNIEVMKESITPFMIGITVAQAILMVVLTVVFFIFYSKLRKGKTVNVTPYFLYLLPFVYAIVSGLIQGLSNGQLGLFGQLVNVLFCIPAVLAIIAIFKLEPEE